MPLWYQESRIKTEACCARSGTGTRSSETGISDGGQQKQDHCLGGQNEKQRLE